MASTKNPWEKDWIKVYAPRKRRVNPGSPEGAIVLYERSDRHPNGELTIAEGETKVAYPTARVMEHITAKRLERRELKDAAPAQDEISGDELGSLNISAAIQRRLVDAGLPTVHELVTFIQGGDPLTSIDGITSQAEKRILDSLVSAGHFKPEDLDLAPGDETE